MRDTTNNRTLDIYEALQNGVGLDPAAVKAARDEMAAEQAAQAATPQAPKRKGRPPKNGDHAMSAAQRQKQYRRRTQTAALNAIRDEISNLTLSQLMTKLQLLAAWLKDPENTMPSTTQSIISDTLRELRHRLVDLPI